MKTPTWRIALYFLVILFGVLTTLPNVLPPGAAAYLPSAIANSKVSLGLDLRGGSHLVLEVDHDDLLKEKLQNLMQDARGLLRTASIKATFSQSMADGVTVRLQEPGQVAQAKRELQKLASPIGLAVNGQTSDLDIAETRPGILTVKPSEAGITASLNSAAEQSIEIIRQRVDQVGVAEPTIQRVGPNRILVQLPGAEDPSRLRSLLGSTAKMSFHMLAADLAEPGILRLKDDEGRVYPIQRRIELSGDHLSDAKATFDPNTNEPVVSFRFDSAGALKFAKITADHVGEPFAIVLDDKVLSAPVIREPITGGSGQISGNFTVQEANYLSALLRAGALPAKLTVIEERTVGADLGSDAIRMGLYTGIAGFILVIGFMVVLYGAWGLLANLALGLNVVLTFAALSLLGATLTLPGIAGIILGIGLAVDANVLINERIREETRKGRSAIAAIDAGFSKAYSTIIDSNMTALIATILLFWLGSGPVRGFAITMALGIAISMFTAVAIVRVVMIAVVDRSRLKVIDIKPLLPLQLVPDGTRIQFMRARFFGIGMSAFLSITSIVLFFYPGLNYGVDFKGGIQIEVTSPQGTQMGAYRAKLDSLGLGGVTLQELEGGKGALIRVERQAGGEEAQTSAINKVKAGLVETAPDIKFEKVEVIGPKVSGELASAGILSVILASLAMLVYISVRFEWPFAVGAIVTLVLDITKTIGFFALTGLEFNLTAIAAVLTLIGYSVNDKVVVYDRMRENMRLFKAMPLRELIDKSINETLGRSLYTSVTAFLALLPMALWGGSAVSSFAIPMVFGIAIAASSSVFIAAPILLFLGDWRKRREARITNAEIASELR